MAAEIAKVNDSLHHEGRKFMLMAPGRWGTADASRGIPVSWSDIEGSAFIVETSLPGKADVPLSQDRAAPRPKPPPRTRPRAQPGPSCPQGSHFFQNIISFGTLIECRLGTRPTTR